MTSRARKSKETPMDYTVIHEHVNRLSDAMIAKGLHQPRAEFQLRSHCGPRVYITWEPRNKRPGDLGRWEFFEEGTVGEMLATAAEFIAKLPDAEETKFKEFMSALGGVIDLGNANGIEIEFLNPLRATMKKLSENALTFQPSASLSASQKEQARV